MSATALGTLRFWQDTGQPYADLLKEAIKPALGMTAVTKYMGASVSVSVYAGLATVVGMLALSIVMGWLVVRYRVLHSQRVADWRANPAQCRQIELLEEIAKNTKAPRFVRVSGGPA
jgi:hypothetical protein